MEERIRPRMPLLFVGHGSPMNAIEENEFSSAWSDVTTQFPRPEAILCISAHWETEGTHVTAMSAPRTIHDFYGFPEALFQVQYPAPGSPELAQNVQRLVGKAGVGLDYAWGSEHGAWSVLARMYPGADIPLVQLSLDRSRPARYHYELARELIALREQGVLIVGSGNIVHNLSLLDWHAFEPFAWAGEFDRLTADLILATEHDKLIDYQSLGESARLSIPTNEHYLPLLYVLALQQPGERVDFFAEGFTYGSLSMRSVVVGGL